MQTRRQSHVEVLANQIIGIAGGWLIVYLLFPFFDHLPQAYVATISSALFFTWSYARSYALRRFFNRRAGGRK